MRVFTFLTLFLFGLGASVMTHAASKPSVFFWGDHHFDHQTFKPYIGNSRMNHAYRWDNDNWTPEDWIERHGSKEAVMGALKRSHIIDEVDTLSFWQQEQTPVLEVGYAFSQISNKQKRRVLEFVDYVYDVTKKSEQGAILIEDDKTNVQIGVYTKLGLQLN